MLSFQIQFLPHLFSPFKFGFCPISQWLAPINTIVMWFPSWNALSSFTHQVPAAITAQPQRGHTQPILKMPQEHLAPCPERATPLGPIGSWTEATLPKPGHVHHIPNTLRTNTKKSKMKVHSHTFQMKEQDKISEKELNKIKQFTT